jgi:short-chain Z-isoprenyl diphosphate synthase
MLRPIHRLYAWRLRSRLAGATLPRHVALVMDCNRRWARDAGFDDPGAGHRQGGDHLREVLGWCAEAGIAHVTVFVASIDNVRKRAPAEVAGLMRLIEEAAAEHGGSRAGVAWAEDPRERSDWSDEGRRRLLGPRGPRERIDRIKQGVARQWRLHVAGDLDVLPDSTRAALRRAVEASARHDTRFHLTVAVGYDGRAEIAAAVRSLLADEARAGASLDDVADRLTPDDIAARLYTAGQPDPDLVIRTSGERRASGFLLWQAAHSRFYFCDVYWPGFRRIDFLRALRSYAMRAGR